ncbi:MauE/DoxX family redox-associated membrane protein [Streptomyces sp. NPDC003077]|uniref:MauE/DoxX family redox-associated membrane protein n=1 Tax=Streptomyces sp. NPDC003077 TaxID=3154443 RepID=UPI0033AADE10
MTHALTILGIQWLLGTVFLISAVSKMAGRQAFAAFADSVRAMANMPARARSARPVSVAVVTAECAVCALFAVSGLLSLYGRVSSSQSSATAARLATSAGAALAATLLVAFAIAIVRTVRRGARTPCRCFGASAAPLGPRHVVRNAVLAGLAVYGAVLPVSGAPLPYVPLAHTAVAAMAGLLLGGLAALLDELVALFRPLRSSGTA